MDLCAKSAQHSSADYQIHCVFSQGKKMKFRAIQSNNCSLSYNSERDKPAGVLGVITDNGDEVVLFSSDSKAEAELHAKAFYYDNPDGWVFVVDGSNRVHGIYDNQAAAAARAQLSDLNIFAYCLFLVFILNLVLAAVLGSVKYGSSAVLLFVITGFMTLIYFGMVKSKMQDSIEGGLLATVLSTLSWALVFWLM